MFFNLFKTSLIYFSSSLKLNIYTKRSLGAKLEDHHYILHERLKSAGGLIRPQSTLAIHKTQGVKNKK